MKCEEMSWISLEQGDPNDPDWETEVVRGEDALSIARYLKETKLPYAMRICIVGHVCWNWRER
jgi:hypothetical protein